MSWALIAKPANNITHKNIGHFSLHLHVAILRQQRFLNFWTFKREFLASFKIEQNALLLREAVRTSSIYEIVTNVQYCSELCSVNPPAAFRERLQSLQRAIKATSGVLWLAERLMWYVPIYLSTGKKRRLPQWSVGGQDSDFDLGSQVLLLFTTTTRSYVAWMLCSLAFVGYCWARVV